MNPFGASRVALAPRESEACQQLLERDAVLRKFLATSSLANPVEMTTWLRYFVGVKDILGNVNNSVSLLATLLAKQFLEEGFRLPAFDAAAKPQGATGPDIDVTTLDGERIIAEVKTTSPYRLDAFGAAQEREFRKDFAKLNACGARHRFLFVTDARTFELLRGRYLASIPGVRIVELLSRSEVVG